PERSKATAPDGSGVEPFPIPHVSGPPAPAKPIPGPSVGVCSDLSQAEAPSAAVTTKAPKNFELRIRRPLFRGPLQCTVCASDSLPTNCNEFADSDAARGAAGCAYVCQEQD
ncbi:MAG TPA: hypothetical protein VFG30_03210, partial [Polyangiales bacterium]|nr:hypothetical protein [Polyangiales bacterium]